MTLAYAPPATPAPAADGRGSGRIAPAGFRFYAAQYAVEVYDAQHDRGIDEVGYLNSLLVASGPGEVGRAEALANVAMPEGARLLSWWPADLSRAILSEEF